MPRLILAGVAALFVATPMLAQPNEQLQQLIDAQLTAMGIDIDESKLTNEQAAALHLELSSTETGGHDFTTRQKVLNILRDNPDTTPVMQ